MLVWPKNPSLGSTVVSVELVDQHQTSCHGKGQFQKPQKTGPTRAVNQDEEDAERREARSVAGISDINGRSKRIELSVSDYRNTACEAHGGRLVVAQMPGLESSYKLVRLG